MTKKIGCKNDKLMFCSKCILKHTEMKHDIIQISPKIEEMKKMIEEMDNQKKKKEPLKSLEHSRTGTRLGGN